MYKKIVAFVQKYLYLYQKIFAFGLKNTFHPITDLVLGPPERLLRLGVCDLAEVDLVDLEDSVPGPQLAALLCRAAGLQLLDEDANLGIVVRIIGLLGPF